MKNQIRLHCYTKDRAQQSFIKWNLILQLQVTVLRLSWNCLTLAFVVWYVPVCISPVFLPVFPVGIPFLPAAVSVQPMLSLFPSAHQQGCHWILSADSQGFSLKCQRNLDTWKRNNPCSKTENSDFRLWYQILKSWMTNSANLSHGA